MTEQRTSPSDDSHPEELRYLSPPEILLVWQHFANIGGHDKDRMVAMMTILSPILLATIGFAYNAENPQREVAAVAGFVTALIATVVVLMYAGYANRNWEKADDIAETYLKNVTLKGMNKRGEVVVQPLSKVLKEKELDDYGWLGILAHKLGGFLSRPHDPSSSLAPIFMLFFIASFILSVLSLAVWKGWIS
jgi:hypothetical protein